MNARQKTVRPPHGRTQAPAPVASASTSCPAPLPDRAAPPASVAHRPAPLVADLTDRDLTKVAECAAPGSVLEVGELIEALQYAAQQTRTQAATIKAAVIACLSLLPREPMLHPALRPGDIDQYARFAEAEVLAESISAVRELLAKVIEAAADEGDDSITQRALEAGAWVFRSSDMAHAHHELVALRAPGC